MTALRLPASPIPRVTIARLMAIIAGEVSSTVIWLALRVRYTIHMPAPW